MYGTLEGIEKGIERALAVAAILLLLIGSGIGACSYYVATHWDLNVRVERQK